LSKLLYKEHFDHIPIQLETFITVGLSLCIIELKSNSIDRLSII